MSRSDALTLVAFAIFGSAFMLAPEHAWTTMLVAGMGGALAFVHGRLVSGPEEEDGNREVPLGDGAVVKVHADGPDAFLLGVREVESGARVLFCTGECPNAAMSFALSDGDAESRFVPIGGRRSTFEVADQAFVVVHRGAGSLVSGVRSGEALETLRALAALGRPSVTIEEGRMEVRVEGNVGTEARRMLVAFARAVHGLAADAALAHSTERGAYR